MKWFWKASLKLSTVAAEKLYGKKVVQVDIWQEGGSKLMVMSADEVMKLKYLTKKLSEDWTKEERSLLAKAVTDIRAKSGGDNG